MPKKDVPISYRKSFLAKYILSDDRVKEVYGKLKNKLMSIKGMKSRNSWFYDAFNVGRLNFAKLSVRGKYVALYLNLSVKEYPENIYHQEFVGDRRRFGDTSFKIHVKSDRTIKYAFRLIDEEIMKFNLETGPIPNENYYLEYEDEAPLIKRNLIKIVPEKYVYEAEVKVKADTHKEESIFDEGLNNTQVIFVDGSKVFVKQRKSFSAKLIQSSQELQNYYSAIKNQILSFVKVKSRLTWKYESFTKGKTKLAKIQIRGKHLVCYLALDPNKYKRQGIENASDNKTFSETPVMIRIKSDKKLEKCLSLISDLKKRFLLEEGFITEDHPFFYQYKSDESLIEGGLIKVYAKFGEDNAKAKNNIVLEGDNKKNNSFPVYAEEEQLILDINEETNNFEEKIVVTKILLPGERDVVYLDAIEQNYKNKDVVDIDNLKEKGLLTKEMRFYKVVYRGGNFTKKLTIKAAAISPLALKVLEQVGGKYINEVRVS